MAIGAAIATGIASLAGNVIQNYSQDVRDQKAREWQEMMVDKANAYNHPAAVMMRLKQAGLNPNLVAGQPVQGSASVPSASQGSKSASFDDIAPNVVNTVMQAKQMELQEKQAKSTMRLEAAQASVLEQEARDKKNEIDARERGYNRTSYVDVGSSFDPDNPETYSHTTNFNYYDSKIAKEVQGYLSDTELKINEQYISGINRILKEHELTFSEERVSHAATIIANELRAMDDAHNVSEANVLLLKQQVAAMWSAVAQGLYAKSHIELDENGNPVKLKDAWQTYYQTKDIITDVLQALGLGAQVIGSIRGAVAKQNEPRVPFNSTTRTDYYDADGVFQGHIDKSTDYQK